MNAQKSGRMSASVLLGTDESALSAPVRSLWMSYGPGSAPRP